MKQLNYGDLLSPFAINTSAGAVKKPTLRDIYKLGYEQFALYEFFLKMTPELFFAEIAEGKLKKEYANLPDEEKQELTTYSLVVIYDSLQKIYSEIFEFFFKDKICYNKNLNAFCAYNTKITKSGEISGSISSENFNEIIHIMQQICCIDEPTNHEKPKFKNKIAEKLFAKMKKAAKEQKKNPNANNSLENIISAVASVHPSINLVNIWDLTLFQLFDTFYRLQAKLRYDLDATRVSVWGDKNRDFDRLLWLKNRYDMEDENVK